MAGPMNLSIEMLSARHMQQGDQDMENGENPTLSLHLKKKLHIAQ